MPPTRLPTDGHGDLPLHRASPTARPGNRHCIRRSPLSTPSSASTPSRTTHTLNELIAATRDGQAFYEEGARKVEDRELGALFTRIAKVKAHVVEHLGTAVASAGGEPEQDGTLAGSMQMIYGKLRSALGDKQYGFVAELEESEDRLAKAFADVIADESTPQPAREVAQRLLPEVSACHEVMRNRKQAMEQAA
jgi:uncharacterized protein (TIGR02284 family)